MDQFSETELMAARKLIDAVDLNPTIHRLMTVHHWKKKQALEAVKQYRNYLFLRKKYDHQYVSDIYALPPSYDIDEVWHAHILHTEDYYDFCKQAFGHFLHHHPHHGKDNTLTDSDIEQAFEGQTQKLYYAEFGEHIEAIRPLPFKVTLKRLWKLLWPATTKSRNVLATH
jgi:hypothetical protein